VVDVGRGTPEDFAKAAGRIAGRVVLADHEYPFASRTIHRRVKYAASIQHGAVAFLIANNVAGDLLVTGSCGQDGADNIPAAGISLETARRLRRTPGVRVRMRQAHVRPGRTGTNLIAEIPGTSREWVIVCAHYDGHDLAQSALDNATGVVSAIAALDAFAAKIPGLQRGLRLVLFTAEETGLLGSERYVASLSELERRAIAAVVNLDTLAGSTRMACLTSGFEELENFVGKAAEAAGLSIPCIRPLLRNSDHFRFAEQGIPALRLIAGFDEPEAGARFILTEGDTADRVVASELEHGATVAAHLVGSALTWPGAIAAHRAPLT
jgi:Zn-dependent M28 family amino/carboxypeptidase